MGRLFRAPRSKISYRPSPRPRVIDRAKLCTSLTAATAVRTCGGNRRPGLGSTASASPVVDAASSSGLTRYRRRSCPGSPAESRGREGTRCGHGARVPERPAPGPEVALGATRQRISRGRRSEAMRRLSIGLMGVDERRALYPERRRQACLGSVAASRRPPNSQFSLPPPSCWTGRRRARPRCPRLAASPDTRIHKSPKVARGSRGCRGRQQTPEIGQKLP